MRHALVCVSLVLGWCAGVPARASRRVPAWAVRLGAMPRACKGTTCACLGAVRAPPLGHGLALYCNLELDSGSNNLILDITLFASLKNVPCQVSTSLLFLFVQFDFGSSGFEEEFVDDYFPRLDTDKISNFYLEDLEMVKLEGYGSIPTDVENANLLVGICMFSPPLSYYKFFIISD